MATTKQDKKQWVFKKLVKREDDFVGLIAYGLYKQRKTEIAESLRKKRTPESEIETRLKSFHEQEVQGNGALEVYRTRAERLVEVMFEATYKSAKQEALDCILTEAAQSRQKDMGAIKKFFIWLFSGVPSAVATIFLAAVVLGVLALFSGPAGMGTLASGVVNKAAGEEIVKPAVTK